MRLLKLLSLPALLLFSHLASAAEYYWYFQNDIYGHHSSPEGACTSYVNQQNAIPNTNETKVYKSYTINADGKSAICKINITLKNSGYNFDSTAGIFRAGTECLPGGTYNPATGKCDYPDPEKCEPTIGVLTSHQHRIGDFTGAGAVGGRSDPPGSICKAECQYAWDGQAPTSAYRFKDNNPNGVFGTFTYKGNGIECTGGTPSVTSPTSNDPTKEKNKECTNKVTDAEGRISYSCIENDVSKNPGDMNCGSGPDGVYKCTPRPNAPKLEDKNVKKDFSENTNSDGSKTNTTTTTTTTTTCVGAGACSTTTTTHTGTSGTNADGTPGGSSETCVGAGCNGDSDDGSELPEDPAEEQPEECDPETDPNKCGQSSVAGEECEVQVDCTGDAIQCALLRAQKKATCDYEKENDYDSVKEEIKTKAAGDSYSLDTDEFNLSNQFSTGSRFLPSGCPAPRSIYIQTFNKSYQLKYDYLCDFASTLSYLVVAMASLFFMTYVGRSFGGS